MIDGIFNDGIDSIKQKVGTKSDKEDDDDNGADKD